MINELERKILKSLNDNARKSFREVAKEVGTSTTAVYNNVKKMEKSGLLMGYIPLIDDELLGFDLYAVISLKIAQGRLQEVYDKISPYPEVRIIYDTTGEWDALLVCYFRQRSEFDHFLKKKLAIPYIERMVTNVVLNVIKYEKRAYLE